MKSLKASRTFAAKAPKRYRRRKKRTGLSAKVANLTNKMKKIEKAIEQKNLDFQQALSVSTTVNHFFSGLTQDTTTDGRIGSEVNYRYLTFNMRLESNPADTTSCQVRIVWVYDRNTDGAVALWSEIFTGNTITALLNKDSQYLGRFQVLYDNVCTLEPGGHSFLKGTILLHGKKEIFKGTNNLIASIAKGSIHLHLYSEGNTNPVTGYIDGRITYTDP